MTHGTDIESPAAEPGEERRPPTPPPDPEPVGRPAGGAAAAGEWLEPEVEEVSLLSLAGVLLRRWRIVVFTPMAFALVMVVIALLLPLKYRATTSFVSESEGSEISLPSGLTGLAAQFGMALPMSGINSPAFYADVIESRTLRDAVLLAVFPDPRTESPGDSASLLDILEIEGETQAERLEVGREMLDESVGTEVNAETRIVALRVETHYPELSALVANLHVDLLQSFNLETRRSNARARRQFIGGRIEQARAELLQAEEALKLFLERNRQYAGSPELQFQYDRLQRQVDIKQEVLSTLTRQFEEARIQEVNDTPVITVIDRAVPPTEQSSPKRRLLVITAFLVGAFLGLFGAFGREALERAEESDSEGYVELTSSWSVFKREVRGLFRRRFKRQRGED